MGAFKRSGDHGGSSCKRPVLSNCMQCYSRLAEPESGIASKGSARQGEVALGTAGQPPQGEDRAGTPGDGHKAGGGNAELPLYNIVVKPIALDSFFPQDFNWSTVFCNFSIRL